jgi:hypothetical protein
MLTEGLEMRVLIIKIIIIVIIIITRSANPKPVRP